MFSFDPNSKIDFLDSLAIIKKKIKLVFCESENVIENGLLAFTKVVLWPISQLRIERINELNLEGEVPEKWARRSETVCE